MAYKYSAIKLNSDFSNYHDEEGSPLKEINGLSSINIIVGSNNSGKSRFLRELIKISEYEFKISNSQLDFIVKDIIDTQRKLSVIEKEHPNIVSFSVGDKPGVSFSLSSLSNQLLIFNYDYLTKSFLESNPFSSVLSFLKLLKGGNYSIDSWKGAYDIQRLEFDIKNLLDSKEELLKALKEISLTETKFKKFYIPTLRSLNYFGFEDAHKETDLYQRRVSEKYKLNEESLNLNIFTGQRLYNTVRSMLLGDADQRERIAKYEKFLSTKLFNEKEVSLIPKEKDDVLHVKIGEEEYAIYDLGDGVQSLIILTFPLFEVENGIFFIEEPEIHLHPGLQRKLIEVLKEMKNHQYFITTHSNHFLDLTLDCADTSIYTFNKQSDSTAVSLVSRGDENILQLLGAKNSSVFLSNCTIWVEGITDRLYIRKYLELYQKDKDEKIQEDIDYSFVEYGGNNITHWSFLDKEEYPINIERLCGKSFVVTDADGDKKIERKEELKKNLGDRYKLLECNEIENTLSIKTIERVLRSYEKNNDFKLPKFKGELPHKKEKIGSFIHDRIFKEQLITRNGGYKADSGTLKDKVNFCKRAIENMGPDEMSSLSLDLSKTIYDFVLQNKAN